MDLGSIIIKPVITEKSMDAVKNNKYTFVVSKDANKNLIKKAIENKFKVDVLSISTNIVKGRTMRVGIRRTEVKKSSFKKAICLLKEGQKIDLFEPGT